MRLKVFNAISFRIAILFSLSTVTILIIMGFVILLGVSQHFESEDRVLLEGKIQSIQNLLKQNPTNTSKLNALLKDSLIGHDNLIVQIERPVNQIVFNSAQIVLTPHSTTDQNQWLKWEVQNKNYRGLAYQNIFEDDKDAQSTQIIVAIDTSEHISFLKAFKRQLFYICLIGALCLMFLGWFAVWRGLRPIKKIAQVAEGISAQHLSERLEVENTPTELKPLTIAFNEMLDRLESALEKLSDFSSDLAHEIRTPINNLMTQTQVCLSRSRDIEAYKEVLFSNLEECEHLARVVSDMLFLA
ncbi:MAG: HAMP domain-containing protein, partial [Staphylococcus equorum]|nr:HAMP domain-containing protein [Staphylococcus equorum]